MSRVAMHNFDLIRSTIENQGADHAALALLVTVAVIRNFPSGR